jgi:hypothetical protein
MLLAMKSLLAQVVVTNAGIGSYSFASIAIFIIIVAAIVAIVFVALRQFGIAIPAFVVYIFWILVCAVVCILAIRFLMSL